MEGSGCGALVEREGRTRSDGAPVRREEVGWGVGHRLLAVSRNRASSVD